MKKLIALLLAMILVFAFASCKKKCDTHVDDNNDGICDVCEKDVPKTPTPPNPPAHTVHTDNDANGLCDGCNAMFIDYSKPTTVGKILKSSLEKQFNEVKSAKVELELDIVTIQKEANYGEKWNEELGEYVTDTSVIDKTDLYRELHGKLEMLIDLSGDSVNAKVVFDSYGRSDLEDDYEVVEPQTLYIIDGYAYVEDDNGIYVMDRIFPVEITRLIEELKNVKLFNEEERSELLNALGAEFATVFSLKDNKGSFSFDAKPSIDNLFEYIEEIDPEVDTVGGLIDDILSLVDKDLTVADLVTELRRLAGLSVNEALAELNAWLTENHSTTLQDLYDTIVNDPEIVALLEEYIISINDLDPEIPEDKKFVEDMIKEAQSFVIANAIAEAEIGEIPLYDIIISEFSEPPAEDGEVTYVDVDEFFERINQFLVMPLADFEEMVGTPFVLIAKDIASSYEIAALNGKLDINFEGMLKLKSIDGVLNVDVSYTTPSDVEGLNDYDRLTLSVAVKITELSTDTVTVALPEGAVSVDSTIADESFFNQDGSYVITDYYVDEENGILVDVTMRFDDPDTGYRISLFAYNIPYAKFGRETVIDDYIVTCEGTTLSVPENSSFTLILDPDTETFSTDVLPAYLIPTGIVKVLNGFANNGSSSFNGYTLTPEISTIVTSDSGFRITLVNNEYIENVYFNYVYDTENDSITCTVVGFTTAPGKSIYSIDKSHTWYGGTYDLNEINTLLGDTVTFTIYIDEATNTVTIDKLPEIVDEYKA